MTSGHDHDHDDHHDVGGNHDHAHPHRHPFQADDRTADPEITLMEQALRELLIEKGVITPEELRNAIEAMEARDGGVLGSKVVARAWTDPEYRQLLMSNGPAAIAKFGATLGLPEFIVVENTPDVHNVVVCTLCSCYPRGLLGLPPGWYKSKEYRSRVVREPRLVLKEFGTVLAEDVELRVHDSTADLRFMVLPMRPKGTDGMSEAELAELVTRDSLVGVSLPRTP